MKNDFYKLMLVTHKKHAPIDAYLQFVATCIKAGVTCVQLREKDLSYQDLLFFGKSLRSLLSQYGVPLIINDSLELCMELDAEGVHLGQTDGDPVKARVLLGPNKKIGLSVNSTAEIEIANRFSLDYIGLGALFPTQNKPDIETVWGLEGLQRASKISRHPIVAIGGINEKNTASVMQTGSSGIAGIGVFHDAPDAYASVKNLIKIVNGGNNDG